MLFGNKTQPRPDKREKHGFLGLLLPAKEQYYHIYVTGLRITHKPLTLRDIASKYCSVKNLERTGHVLRPVIAGKE